MKKKILLILMLLLTVSFNIIFAGDTKYLQTYSDVSTWHWAYETIEKLSSKGIISGYPDGSFMPENTITRAEATKLLMLALNENHVFSYGINVCEDVPARHWASKYIINGRLYIKPYDDGLFRPEQKITRLEFANAVAESLKFVIITTDADTNVSNITLNDISNLDVESINNIKFLVKLGIINGYEDNTFRPNKTLTRAEVCKILSLSLIYKEGEINDVMSKTTSWYKCDPESGWHAPVSYDVNGNIKYSVINNGVPTQLYYNGKYFMTSNPDITTVKQEKLYTSDGKVWDIRWFGGDVVEYVVQNGKHKIINYYQEKEYEFNTEFISEEEAIKILEELFPYAEYDFNVEEDKIYSYKYVAGTQKNMGTMSVSDSYFENNNEIKVSVADLQAIIWSEEVNDNTQSTIDFYDRYK